VKERDDESPDGTSWDDWLQTNRIELNTMTTPAFIAWLDAKMAEHGDGKLIPPAKVLEADLAERINKKARAIITERILREAGFENQVTKAIGKIKKPTAAALKKGIRALYEDEVDREWRDHIETVATEQVKKVR
jgi:hypothetical protein